MITGRKIREARLLVKWNSDSSHEPRDYRLNGHEGGSARRRSARLWKPPGVQFIGVTIVQLQKVRETEHD